MTEPIISLAIKLTEVQAQAFAEFLKRADPDDFFRRAGDQREADQMMDAASAIRQALNKAGFAPR